MYDGRSLTKLVESVGFIDVTLPPAGETRIPEPGPLDLFERADESVYLEASSRRMTELRTLSTPQRSVTKAMTDRGQKLASVVVQPCPPSARIRRGGHSNRRAYKLPVAIATRGPMAATSTEYE